MYPPQQQFDQRGGYDNNMRPRELTTGPYSNQYNDHYFRIGQGSCSRNSYTQITTLAVDPFFDLVWSGTSHGYVKGFEFVQGDFSFPVHRSFISAREEPVLKVFPFETSIFSFSRSGLSVHSRDGMIEYSDLGHKYITDAVYNRNDFYLSSRIKPICEWNPEKDTCQYFPSSTSGSLLVRSSGKFIVTGLASGKVRVWDRLARKSISSVNTVHAGSISDICVGGHLLVTCGFGKKYGRMEHDQFVKVFDMRNFQLINQMRFKHYASFLKFHPFLPSTICICSKSLGFQFRNIDNQFLVPNLHYVQPKGGGGQTSAFDLSLSGDVVVLGNSRGEVSFWSFTENARLHNRQVEPLEVVSRYTSEKYGYNQGDVEESFGLIPTYVQREGEEKLSEIEDLNEVKFVVGQHPPRIHPIIADAAERATREKHPAERTEFPIFRNPGLTTMREAYLHITKQHTERGVVYFYRPYQDKYVQSTMEKIQVVPSTHSYERFVRAPGDRNLHGAMGLAELQSELEGERKVREQLHPIRYVGFRNDFENSNINAVVQTLYHLCPDQIRCSIMSHLCKIPDCLACHLGFLFTYMTQVINNTNDMNHRKRIFYPSFFMRALYRRINTSNMKKLKLETSLHFYFRVFIKLLCDDLAKTDPTPSPPSHPRQKGPNQQQKGKKKKNQQKKQKKKQKKKKKKKQKKKEEEEETTTSPSPSPSPKIEEEGKTQPQQQQPKPDNNKSIYNIMKYLFEGERVNWFRCKKCGHVDERDVFTTDFIDLIIPKRARLEKRATGPPPAVSYFSILDRNSVHLEFSSTTTRPNYHHYRHHHHLRHGDGVDGLGKGTNDHDGIRGGTYPTYTSGDSMTYIHFQRILENSFTRFERSEENWCSKCAQTSKFPMFSSYRRLPRILSLFINYRFLDWLRIQHQINGLVGKNNRISLPSKIIIRRNSEKRDWDIECIFQKEDISQPNEANPEEEEEEMYRSRSQDYLRNQSDDVVFGSGNNAKNKKSSSSSKKKKSGKKNSNMKEEEVEGEGEGDENDKVGDAKPRKAEDNVVYIYELRSVLTTIVDPFYNLDERFGKGSIHHPVSFVKVDVSRPFEDTSNFDDPTKKKRKKKKGKHVNEENVPKSGGSSSYQSTSYHHSMYSDGHDGEEEGTQKKEKKEWFWYLFNDHNLSSQPPHSVYDFSGGRSWKVPNVLFYVQTSPQLPKQEYKNPVLRPELTKMYPSLKLDTILPGVTRMALDAEFIQVKPSIYSNKSQPFHSIGRLSIVDEAGKVIMDDVVEKHKSEQIANYLTEWSGLRKGDLTRKDTRYSSIVTLKEVYIKVRALLDRGVRVVGHGLENDFKNIPIWVNKERVDDTVLIWRLGPNGRLISLKWLTQRLLQKSIQQDTHCSVEDSRASLELFKMSQNLKKQQRFNQILQQIYDIGQRDNWRL